MTDREFYDAEIETMPRSALGELQLEKLRRIVESASTQAPLYREMWSRAGVSVVDVSTIEAFQASVPLLTKSDLVAFRDAHADPFCGILCAPTSRIGQIGTTSGSTSEPMPLIEIVDGQVPFPATVRDMWGAGLRPGDHVIPVMAVQRGPQERTYQQLGCVPLIVDLRIQPDWEAVFSMMARYRPASIYLLGPMVAELDRLSDRYDLRSILSCLKFAVFSGEPLGSRMRRRLTDDWGLDLYEVTGTADIGVAWDCRMHDGYHVWEDHVLAVCVDPVTGSPVPDGEVGELVCTALSNPVWPLIRHRSGDLVRFATEPCGCGRTHRRFQLIGRISDRVDIAGVDVMPSQVWEVIEQFDETATGLFQIVHPAPTGGLHIRVGYRDREPVDVHDLEARLRIALTRALSVQPSLQLMPEATLLADRPSGIKLPRVVRN